MSFMKTKRLLPCESCGRPITTGQAAARVLTDLWTIDATERRWCLGCWDNDPRAVEQYHEAGSVLIDHVREANTT